MADRSPPPAESPLDSVGSPQAELDNPDYWYALIDETLAADFLDVTPRTMQAHRQRGGGPRFCRLSARCIKYRRIDLRQHAEERLRNSTADKGDEEAEQSHG